VGGSSVDNEQIMFGYSVTRLIDPNKVATTRARDRRCDHSQETNRHGVISTGIKTREGFTRSRRRINRDMMSPASMLRSITIQQ